MKSQTPKVLHPMCGRSLLGHAIAAARALNPEHLVVVVRHERDAVAAHALACDPEILIADQDEIKGTGRAVWCGLSVLPEGLEGGVLVMAGDTPLLGAAVLRELMLRHDGAVTVLTTEVEDATGYGRIVRDSSGVISRIVEHKDATEIERSIREINTSTYVFDAGFLKASIAGLGTSNAQGEMYLTDVVAAAYEAKAGVNGYLIEDSWLVEGCNDLVQLAALREEMNRRVLESWMRQGVAVVSPASVSIDVTVRLEPDSRILPGTALYGNTLVKKGALVGPGEFTDTVVGSGAKACHVVARGVEIKDGEELTPYIFLSSDK